METTLIEIPLLLAMLGTMLSRSVQMNFIIYRTCTVILQANETECVRLGSSDQNNMTRILEAKVEPYANTISLTLNLTSSIIPSLLCLFIGHWSDKNGRKKVLVVAMLGHTCTTLIILLVSFFPSASPWYLVAQAVPNILSGGAQSIGIVAFCYLTETTEKENLSLRMGILEIIFGSVMIISTSSSAYILNAIGYTLMFGIGMALEFFCFLFLALFLKESVIVTNPMKLTEMFSVSMLKEMLQSVTKSRPNNSRNFLYLLISSVLLQTMASGAGGIVFQYLRLHFSWDLIKFNWLIATYFITNFIGTFIGMYLMHKLCGVPESVLMILSICSFGLSCILSIFATGDWFFFVGAGVNMFSGLLSPITRSLVSGIVGSEEVGKVFSIMTMLQALLSIASSSMFTVVYNNTLETYPTTFLWMCWAIYMLHSMVIMIIVMKMMKKQTENNNTETASVVENEVTDTTDAMINKENEDVKKTE